MEDKKQPIIVKRINKGGHGHHGGSWKVAFADFAVAMMAFFMVMWLLGAVPTETLGGISDYYENVSLTEGTAPVATQGMAGPGGASTSMIDMGGMMDIAKGEGTKINQQNKDRDDSIVESDKDVSAALKAENDDREEKRRLNELMKDMVDAIGKNKALSPFKDQLILKVTAEGLQIQIVDKEGRAMFDPGGSHLKNHMRIILFEIAGFLDTVPNRISVSGHTDASPFTAKKDYSNWELSSDRANSARRTLEEGGMATEKVGRVEGLASSQLLSKDEPFSTRNRRISILVMNKKTEAALMGIVEDIDPDTGKPFPINNAPAELPPLQLQPTEGPINPEPEPTAPIKQLEEIPGAENLNTAPESQPVPELAPTEEENELPAEPIGGIINLPPIINPSLLPGN